MTGTTEEQKRELLRRLLRERAARSAQPKFQSPTHALPATEELSELRAVARVEPLQLSFGQEMIWILDQMLPDAMLFNVVERFGFTGALDVEILRRSLDEIIKRHEILRTVYPIIEGQAVQHVNPPYACDLPLIDLRRFPAQERESEAKRLIAKIVKTKFDLTRDETLRLLVLRLDDKEYKLALAFHHIGLDGWSLRLLMHELAAIYSALVEGGPAKVQPIPVQYADYAQWQRRTLSGETLEKHRDYWSKTLGSKPPILKLKTDHAPGSTRSFDSEIVDVVVGAETVDGLREISREAGGTFFTVLLAAFSTVLMRYSGQEQFLVGAILSSRVRPEFDNLLGMFVNLLALRVDLSGNPTFSDLVVRARDIVFAAHEHGMYPFQKLVEVLQPKRSANTNPFVQVFINMLNLWDRDDVSAPNLSIRPLGGLELHMPSEFFSVFISGRGRGLVLSFIYSTELFERATIERIGHDFRALLEAVVVSPSLRIWEAPLQGPALESPQDAVRETLSQLGALGAKLSVENDRLKIDAPKGSLTDELKSAIASHREAIIAELNAGGGRSEPQLERIPRQRPLPLSAAQKRFWFLDKLGQGQGVPDVHVHLRFEGPLNLGAMTSALKTIFYRHESLRMRIREQDGEAIPEINGDAEDQISIFDVESLIERDREAACETRSAQFTALPFALTAGPLAEAQLIRVSANLSRLDLKLHPILVDGRSASIVLRDLAAVYSSLVKGEEPASPPLPFQYVDYAAWETAKGQGGAFARQLAYWTQKLAGAPALLDLPTDRPRSPQLSHRGGRFDGAVDAELVERLQQFSRRHNVTLYNVMLAGFALVLHRLSAQEEIVVGAPVANRRSAHFEGVVGPFVNSVPLRLSLAENPSFASYLSQVRSVTLDAIENSELPFERIVEALAPARALGHAPIFQVMAGMHDFPTTPPQFEGLDCVFVKPKTTIVPLDLQLDLWLHEDRLICAYEFSLDLFDEVTIERLHGGLVAVLNEALQDAGRPARDLRIGPSARDVQILQAWNATRSDHDRKICVHQLFERAATRAPDAVAFVIGEAAFTYADIDRRANRLARLLALRGVKPGDKVAICLERSIEAPVALLATWKAGAAYVPLDPAHPASRRRYIIEDSQAVCVVTLSRLVLTGGATDRYLLLDLAASELDRLDASSLAIPVAPEAVAYAIYTSGSTGRPKGVEVEHRNAVSFLHAMQQAPGMAPSDVLLAVTTFSFDIAGLEIWLPLSVGAKVVLATQADVASGESLVALLERHEATIMQATPSTWRLVLDAGWRGGRLKALCGGEAMPSDLARALLKKVSQLWNMYGPTETTIWSTCDRVLDATGALTIGRPIADTRVYVLDEKSALAPLGVYGELAIAGEGVARGYWRRPELSAEKFVDIVLPGGASERVFKTGDVARMRNDGRIEFHGRRDGQIKLRGYRIELGEIEAVICEYKVVKEAVALVREDEPGDPRLVAYVVARQNESFDPALAREILKASLPGYMIPAEFVVVPAMPLNTNGKVDRKALPAPSLHAAEPLRAHTEIVMTDAQRRVAKLWTDLLRNDRFALQDNFFEVGGHSMLVVKLHAALKREFGSEIALPELFQHTTIMAQAARATQAEGDSSALQRAEARARKRLNG